MISNFWACKYKINKYHELFTIILIFISLILLCIHIIIVAFLSDIKLLKKYYENPYLLSPK